MRRLLAAPLAMLAFTAALPAQAPVAFDEWEVPYERSRPRDPYVAPDGSVFFVGQVGNYIARLDQKSGQFTRFEIDPGTNPHNLIIDRRGMVWYAGNRNGMIGRLDPATGAITRYPMPDSTARDPHTLVFDQAGDIWFTAQQSGFVGRLATRTGKIDLIKLDRLPSGRSTLPYGIVIDAKGTPWFCEFGSNTLVSINPRTLALSRFALAHERTRPRRIAPTSDGAIWYVDYARGFLGRLDPATKAVKEWASPAGALSLPYGMAVDDADRLWYVETGVQPNRLVGFDSKTERFAFEQEVGEARANTIRHMYFHPPTRELWYGADQNTIGRVKIPPARALVP
ncbi:MAG: hypothetical protein SFU84_16310 [Gemmatimonadales bacterium]|nr:hypothetical protein [Gemmatimonadales bacterium]